MKTCQHIQYLLKKKMVKLEGAFVCKYVDYANLPPTPTRVFMVACLLKLQ